MSLKGRFGNSERRDAIDSWELMPTIEQEIPGLEESVRDSYRIDIRELTADEYKLLLLHRIMTMGGEEISPELMDTASKEFAEIILDTSLEELEPLRARTHLISGMLPNDAFNISLHGHGYSANILILDNHIEGLPYKRVLPFSVQIGRAYVDTRGKVHWVEVDSSHTYTSQESTQLGVTEIVVDDLGVEVLGDRRRSFARSPIAEKETEDRLGFKLVGKFGDIGVWDNPRYFYYSDERNSKQAALNLIDETLDEGVDMVIEDLIGWHEEIGPVQCLHQLEEKAARSREKVKNNPHSYE